MSPECVDAYEPGMAEMEDVDKRFTYHPPVPALNQAARYGEIRTTARTFGHRLLRVCPRSRELSVALTHLDEVVMNANAAIARNERGALQVAQGEQALGEGLVEHIRAARAAHEVNRTYCLCMGDTSQVPWDAAPQWQRDSALAGVAAIAANPDQTPEESHAGWLAQKQAEGWVYGLEKNVAEKLHPCMVPYAELPAEHKVKDTLFVAVVKSILFG